MFKVGIQGSGQVRTRAQPEFTNASPPSSPPFLSPPLSAVSSVLPNSISSCCPRKNQIVVPNEEELEVYKAGMDQTLIELNELRNNQGVSDSALDGQLDALILSQLEKVNEIIDSVLQASVQRVDDAMYELDSDMQAGNQNASPSYVLSQIEKASASAMEFATAFNNFIADGPNSTHSALIKTINIFSGAIANRTCLSITVYATCSVISL